MEMDNLQYKLIGIIFGTPRDIKEAREWLRRNEFEYIKLHKENDSYVIYYIRKNKELIELSECSSLEEVVNFVNRYCAAIHKMACDTEEKCFDDKFNDRLFSLMALRDKEIENKAKNVEKEPEIEKSDSFKACERKMYRLI